jgi:DNA-directed RNA polymerase subunit N (RpoN/RPB10)
MQRETSPISILLPCPAPLLPELQLLLYAIRRLGTHGLNDAHAAHAMLGMFGQSYRRPLILLRAFLAETARASKVKINIAAYCCRRMTGGESLLIDTVTMAISDPHAAHRSLTKCLGTTDCIGALTSAQALNQAFADLGRPLG